MSKAPIDILLDKLEYEEVEYSETNNPKSDLPCITHQGILEIIGKKIRVYVLSSGERVIDADDLESFLSNEL